MQTRSTGIRNLDGDAYKDLLIPIAPMKEQLQIVSLIETEHALFEALLDQVRLLRIQKTGVVQKLFERDPLMKGLVDLPEENQILGGKAVRVKEPLLPKRAGTK